MRTVHAALLTLLCGASFGLGVYASQGPTAVTAALTGEAQPYNAWREDLAALRGTAEGDALRTTALDAIHDAPNLYALKESVELLGWVGDERDIPLVVQLLHDETIDHTCIETLGRLGAVDELMELTAHPQHRVYAQVGLGLTGQEEALPVLIEGLEDPARRDMAAYGLGRHGSEAAQEALIDAWPDADNWFLTPLANAMSSFPPDSPARTALRSNLTLGSTAQRNAAMTALAQVDDPGLFDALMHAVQNGTPSQRVAALNAMGPLQDPRAVPALAAVAKKGRRDEIWPAIWALDTISDESAEEALRELVRTGSEDVAAYAAGALDPELHTESYEVLLWALDNRGNNTRGNVQDALFQAPWTDIPDRVLELAFQQIEDPQIANRWSGNAWTVVLRYGGPEAHERVAELLLDPDNPSRAEALWALQGQPHLLPNDLAYELLADENPDVRRAALGLLEARGDNGDGKLERALIERLKDPDRVRWDGLEDTLARIGGPDAIDALMVQVKNGTHHQSTTALSALVNTGDPDHIARLQSLYERTEDQELRRRVLDSVLWSGTTVGHEFALVALEREDDPTIRANAASALGSSGTPEAVKALEGLLDDEEPNVRSAALGALASQPGMRPRLIQALDDPDLANTALSHLQNDRSEEARAAVRKVVTDANADVNLRTSAIYQMGWNGGDPSVLADVLDDDDLNVRQAALSALESRGTPESAGHIVSMLDDEDLGAQAAYALQRIGGDDYEANKDRIDEIIGQQAVLYDEDFGHWGGLGGGLGGLGEYYDIEQEIEVDDEPPGDTGWFEEDDEEFSIDTGWTDDEQWLDEDYW